MLAERNPSINLLQDSSPESGQLPPAEPCSSMSWPHSPQVAAQCDLVNSFYVQLLKKLAIPHQKYFRQQITFLIHDYMLSEPQITIATMKAQYFLIPQMQRAYDEMQDTAPSTSLLNNKTFDTPALLRNSHSTKLKMSSCQMKAIERAALIQMKARHALAQKEISKTTRECNAKLLLSIMDGKRSHESSLLRRESSGFHQGLLHGTDGQQWLFQSLGRLVGAAGALKRTMPDSATKCEDTHRIELEVVAQQTLSREYVLPCAGISGQPLPVDTQLLECIDVKNSIQL